MFELLVRFECQKQAFISRRLLRNIGGSGHAYLGIAGLIFFVALFPMLVSPPAAVAEAPPEAVAVGALVLVGFVACATIVLAPLGLILL
jgi:hypothetical protein